MTLYMPLAGTYTDGYDPNRGYVPGLGYLGPHLAQDIAAPKGTPIRAAGAGVVRASWWDVFNNGTPAGGWMTAVDYGGIEVRYAHMEAPGLSAGTRVTTATVLGTVGMSGSSNGYHVHVEVKVAGRLIDPLGVLLPFTNNPNTETEDDMIILNIQGKAGARRGGAYLLRGATAVFLGGTVAGAATVTDETAITRLQGMFDGLR